MSLLRLRLVPRTGVIFCNNASAKGLLLRRTPTVHACVRSLHSSALVLASRSGLADQLRSSPSRTAALTPESKDTSASGSVSAAVEKGPTRMVGANRDFLSGTSTQQVLLHDYRDIKFLKQATAIGVFCTLMSSSGLAYAVSFHMSAGACCGFVFQMVSAAAFTVMYLRTYVARAVLDPRRGQLIVTGCGFFGEPMKSDQCLPLASIDPGAEVMDHYIKFRLRGSALDPSRWVWYRIPRSPAGADGKVPDKLKGSQVGIRPELAQSVSAASGSTAPHRKEKLTSPTSSGHSFRGAGLGSSSDDSFEGGFAAKPTAPSSASRNRAGVAALAAAAGRNSRPTAAASIVGLKLQDGVATNGQEEQKIVDFFAEPLAYAAGAPQHD